ncbi:hypothetical protein [Pseudomonas khavaziana]|uniref:hypothetical protein n=1 Tax=Pseudomonas khavaziana TaxID=2842351 RepID=UPI001C3E1C6F|nr:hypothetical protein [Pseudomonas khavaziana]MBV4478641.1 hypothetical protein [Pseudomonas khavaziana]
MLRKSQIITIPALLGTIFLLTGCPPPAEFTQWQRTSTTVDGVKAAMAECGDPVGGSLTRYPINEEVIHFQCMQRLGFTRKDDFKFCEVMKDVPACVEERIGRPLSLSELEALPFGDDEGFYPIKPDSGRYESMQITWRKMGASPHFSVQLANDKEALPVMYACGYPKPLGSNLAVASIGRTAKAQRCMIDHGFEPKHEMTLVCLPYPQVTGCKNNAEAPISAINR